MRPALPPLAGVGYATDDALQWWHRDHPVFVPLSGFFTGLAFVLLVPAIFAGVLDALLPRHTVQDLFPLVLLTLVVPIALVARPQTRRLGLYFAVGIGATAAVVIGVGWLVLWVLVSLS